MFLRSLTMRGFKSFADKTTLEFTPGISVVVGPNGSGKSNIVDAIAWVLGEQGPRSLRGGQMADVIFAGSPARPALGMAEVRMVIDNSAGLIPVPASEIEISRTVYRSGESEYRLGGRPCRLLDIQELLSDTGIGRALHTIIGQGQLDAVLQARPEERRQFVEEAAGIAKHRRRRERAERKLAGLEQDLLRLQDVLGELRRQLKPLKQQAELARRHEDLSTEAGEIAVKLAAARLRELHQERGRRGPAWERAEARQAQARARMAELDAEIAAQEQQRIRGEGARRSAEEIHGAAVETKSRAEEGLRAAIRAEAGARERLAAATNRSGRLFALEEELERTRAAVHEVEGTLERRQEELEGAEQAFTRAERDRAEADIERRRIAEEAAVRRAEAEALARALAGHQGELERLDAELRDLRAQVAAADARATELGSEVERLDAVETPLAKEQAALERERSELSGAVSDLKAEEKGLLARQEVVDARRAELAESPGARFAGRDAGRAIGVLRELIDAPVDLRPAVVAALGQFADAVVYGTEAEELAAASAGAGQGLTLVTDADHGHPAPVRIPGERALLDAVRPDPRVGALTARLLGDVYLVGNLAEAAAKHRTHPQARFVTPDGAVVAPSFVRTSSGLDQRLEGVRRESAAIDRELSAVHRGLREARHRLAQLAAQEDEVRTALEETDALITAAAEEMVRVRGETTSLRREEHVVFTRRASVEEAAAAARLHIGDAPGSPPPAPPLPPVPEPPIRLRVEVEALRRERGRLEAGVARARRDIESLAAEDPVSLRAVAQAAERERAAAEERLRETESSLAGAGDALRAATEAARAAADDHARANASWRQEAAALEGLRQEHEEEDRARHDLERRIREAERLLREGHGADPDGAVAALTSGDTVEELQRRGNLVARRLGLVGRVNLLATGELEAVQERHDFLAREMDDVRAARRDLQQVIVDVDTRVADLFDRAFRDVAREFAGLFQTMFPGGEGRLTLTDPGDLLGSGIEVEARPGRGKVKRLSLLSGGERSLAALAFLFAIFRARPSPFYLMDEVEAALDDVNLHRFLEVVRAFASDSQVLVVTHQKRTMETADVLYGVSMARDGASTVISQRLLEVAAH
jgi:chromosome segregation protein